MQAGNRYSDYARLRRDLVEQGIGAPKVREMWSRRQARDANPPPVAPVGRVAYRVGGVWGKSVSISAQLAAVIDRQAKRKAAAREQRRQAWIEVIAGRGGETSIETSGRDVTLDIVAEHGDLVLLRCSGWRQYSRQFGARPASLAYLCGTDDSGRWATRVAGSITSIDEALEWLEPAAVRKARDAGRQVWRQGDVYAIETTKAHDGKGAEGLDRHEWHREKRVLWHPEHTPLVLTVPVRFVQQRTFAMGRGRGWAGGD